MGINIVSVAVLRYVGLIHNCPQMMREGATNKTMRVQSPNRFFFPKGFIFIFSWGRECGMGPQRPEKNVSFPVVGGPSGHELPNAGAEN